MTRVSTDQAPGAVADYSQALVHGGVVYCAGQIGFERNPDGGWALATSFQAQALNALRNLQAVLQAAGTDWDRVLKVHVYLTSMEQYGTFNQIYAEFLEEVWRHALGPEAFAVRNESGELLRQRPLKETEGVIFPARAAVAVAGLPKGAVVEVDCIAAL